VDQEPEHERGSHLARRHPDDRDHDGERDPDREMRALEQRESGMKSPQRGSRSDTSQQEGGRSERSQATPKLREAERAGPDEKQGRHNREHLGHAEGMNLMMEADPGEVDAGQSDPQGPAENEERSEHRGAALGQRTRAFNHRRPGSPRRPSS
jgi:hypothetical protein